MTTLLQLVQQATAELGLPVPTIVVGSTAQDQIQQLALINAVCYELQREYEWEALSVEYRFTTQFVTTTGTTVSGSPIVTAIPATTGLDGNYMVVGTGINTDTYVLTNDSATQVTLTQPATASGAVALNFCKTKYAFPSDWDRPTDQTQWDKSKHWQMVGPLTAQQWQFRKSGYISTGPRIGYRNLGGKFQIWPPLSSADYLGFEYISNAWAINAAGTSKTSFTVDTDTCIFPDRLIVLGLKLKYFEIKGFDTTALYRDFINQKDIAKANDKGSQVLSMSPRVSQLLISADNIPDTGYGQ